MKKVKPLILFFITIIFFFFFIGLIFSIALGIWRIKNIDHYKIYSELKTYLEENRGEIYVKLKNKTLYIDYEYKILDGPYKPSHKEFSFSPSLKDYLIYVYGSSPVVSKPPFYKGKFPHFPSLLETQLNTSLGGNFKIYNFAMPSFDSFDAKELIKATVDYKKPDLIIYYDVSASDFESAYFTRIKRHYFLITGFLENLSRLFLIDKIPGLKLLNELGFWFLRAYLEPNLINLAQRLHLVEIESEPFKKYNQLILRHYKENLYEIIDSLQNKNIPLVIITSVLNLEARPFGIYNITDKYYKQGMGEEKYFSKMKYLIKAKDSEIFTGDVGSKSEVYRYLINLKKRGVHIFDLRKRLMDLHFEFNYKYFYDYAHMKPSMHRVIAESLYQFLQTNELLN